MQRIFAITALLCVSISPALGIAQQPSPSPAPVITPAPLDAAMRARIDTDINAIMQQAHSVGASIQIVEGNDSYAQGYGLRDIEHKLPALVDTSYEIGSITKQFTAAGIMQLQEAGKLSIDDPVAKYVPSAPHASEITIRQLMDQTSGLADYLEVKGAMARGATPATFDQIMALVANAPLGFTPGSKWEYSNTNYIILGQILQNVSGQPYNTYLREHLFAPAGMTRATTIANESSVQNMARGYDYDAASGKIVPAPLLDDSFAWSAGNIVSTVGDLQRWNEALTSGKIVTPADYMLMTTPPALANGQASTYGFGLAVDQRDGQRRIWHNGGTFGFASMDVHFPDEHLWIVVLTNSLRGSPEAIAAKIFDDLNPSIAADILKPSPGEDPAVTTRIVAFARPLLKGNLDRSQLTPEANKALTDSTVASVASQLAPLGDPLAFIYKSTTPLAKGTVYVYIVRYAAANFKLTIVVDPATNKFSGFLITPP